jgi:hypothetical protein
MSGGGEKCINLWAGINLLETDDFGDMVFVTAY